MLCPAWSPVVPVSFDVTSPVKLVGRTRRGRLAINGKSKMAERGQVSNFSQKEYGNHISFLPCTTILKCSEGMDETYISEIFPDPRRKKAGFRRAIRLNAKTFSRWTGTFCHFVPGLLAIALGSKPSPLTRIAEIGLGRGCNLPKNLTLFTVTRSANESGQLDPKSCVLAIRPALRICLCMRLIRLTFRGGIDSGDWTQSSIHSVHERYLPRKSRDTWVLWKPPIIFSLVRPLP